MSAVLPGLGQWFQGRRLIGALQLGTVLAYLGTAMATENAAAAFLALAWNVWSSVDAFRHTRREERWRDEHAALPPQSLVSPASPESPASRGSSESREAPERIDR